MVASKRREFVLDMVVIKDLDDETAKLAGEALASLRDVDASVTVDATVMAMAAKYADRLYTGDFDDMQRFAQFFPDVRLFGVAGR